MLRRNILIFHTGALGDFVVTWPIALAMGRLFPQSRIFYVTHASKGKLAEKVLGVQSIDIEAGWHALFSESPELPEKARAQLEGATWIISFVSTGGDAWADNVRQLAPYANLLALLPRPSQESDVHISQFLIDQLQPVPAVAEAVRQITKWINEQGLMPRRVVGRDSLLHPGSGGVHKCWPLEKFIALAERLRAENKSVRFLIGEVEQERWTPDQLDSMRRVVEVNQPPDYLALLDVLSTARMLIANDSGPGHLAGIIGVPTLSLFGPTSPAVWKPLGPRAVAISRDPLDSLEVEEVYGRTVTLLNGQ